MQSVKQHTGITFANKSAKCQHIHFLFAKLKKDPAK